MQLSNIPAKLLLPWATSGNKNAIPVASQIGITAGAASLTDGFPPLTMTPVAAGGVPPSGLDMNGILYEMSAIMRWANAGGGYAYDSTFANDSHVGGYPKGARVMRSDGLGYWLNTVDNNVTDPEAAGSAAAGWVPDYQSGVTAVAMSGSSVTLTPLQYGKRIIAITGTLSANLNLIFPALAGNWVVLNGTTGGYSITAKTAGGTGVALGTVTAIFGDGTNIYATSADAVQIVNNVATLRNIAPNPSRLIQTRGYYTDGDYGQGCYYAKTGAAPGTYVHNGGTVIVPNGGDGSSAWFLMVSGKLIVQQFGTKGDLTTNDYTPFQACLTAASAAGYDVYAAKCAGFKINSPLAFDIAAVSLDCGGNLFDFSSIGAATAWSLNTNSQSDENIAGMYAKLHPITRGIFVGPGPSTTGSRCFNFTSSPKWIHSVTVHFCSIGGFDNDIQVFTNGFLIEFDRCNFLQANATWDTNTVLSIPGGGSNYGEAIKFNSCQFTGAGCVANVAGYASVFFNNCSFDYNDRIFWNTGGGDIIATGCHIESSTDTQYWFETGGSDSTIKLIGCPILITGAKTKEVGKSAAVAGGISLIACPIEGNSSYTAGMELITGTGRVVVKEVSYEYSGNKIVPSKQLNAVPFNGTFEDANSLSTWKLSGTTLPARSNAASHSGTWSMGVVGGVGTTNAGEIIVPVVPGEYIFARGWYYTPDITGTGGTAYLYAHYCDANGNVISAGTFVAVTANMGAWAQAIFDFQPVVPPGVTHVKFHAEIFGVGTGTPHLYVDDVLIVRA